MTPPILVVEDDPSWQQILSEILTDLGLKVNAAGSLETALPLIKSQAHRLAVVDLSLVAEDHLNTDGLKVLSALRIADPLCQVILLTGFATVELAVSVLTEYGAFTFLRKENFQRSHFREVVNKALSSSPSRRRSLVSSATENDLPSPVLARSDNLLKEQALVVEDDAGWRGILAELLGDTGYEVRLCSSYGDGLGCLRRDKFALAVIDLSLAGDPIELSSPADGNSQGISTLGHPIPAGFHLLAEAKAAAIPAIVVSGIASVEEIDAAYSEYSAFAYLEKQAFDRPAFLRLVAEAHLLYSGSSGLVALTLREREVLEWMAKGLTNKEIAASLNISSNTVKRHQKSIFEKLDVHTRSAAVSKLLA